MGCRRVTDMYSGRSSWNEPLVYAIKVVGETQLQKVKKKTCVCLVQHDIESKTYPIEEVYY